MIEYCKDQANSIRYNKGHNRHYAVVVDKRGRVLGESANCYKTTHPLMYRTSRKLGLRKDYVHAEMRSIIRAQKNGIPYKIYVARVDSKGSSVYSAPCLVCCQLIREAGIQIVEYTT